MKETVSSPTMGDLHPYPCQTQQSIVGADGGPCALTAHFPRIATETGHIRIEETVPYSGCVLAEHFMTAAADTQHTM